jgi:5'(3')-deoxyribonucleotidase
MPWMTERTEWLGDYFGWTKAEVVFTSAKYLVIGDAFLDDKPEHVANWTAHHPNGLGMLWRIPNTRTMTEYDKYRVTSWQQVIDRLRLVSK